MTRPRDSQQKEEKKNKEKKKTSHVVDFAVPTDQRLKLKESEKEMNI